MMSPGLSVVNDEKNSTARGTSMIIWEVLADCITWPFSVVVNAASAISTSSGVISSGPTGMLPSKFLPAVHWVAAPCQSLAVASFSTTNPAIAAIASGALM
jgi:hypothetical protein